MPCAAHYGNEKYFIFKFAIDLCRALERQIKMVTAHRNSMAIGNDIETCPSIVFHFGKWNICAIGESTILFLFLCFGCGQFGMKNGKWVTVHGAQCAGKPLINIEIDRVPFHMTAHEN